MATYGEQQAEKLLGYYQGLSGTMDKPSLMASQSEKEAYLAQEARAGRAPVETLPEAYGGRPTGGSRRSIRMAAAYDLAQEKALEQQRIMQQMEQTRLSQQREGWRFNKEQNEYAAQLKLETLNERDAAQESSEVNAIASGLEGIDLKSDPEAGLKIEQLVLENPLGAAREDIAKRLEAARRINGTYGIAATTKAEQEAGKAKAEIINKALGEGVTEAEIEATRFADPKTAVVDYDYGRIERLAAQRAGERKTKEPEEEEYKPISVTEARDRRDVVQAEFDTLSASVEKGELEDDDLDYVKTRARLRRAEAELKVAERAKPSEAPAAPASNLPKTGDVRNGFRYTGPSNDKKAASNPSNWARE
jgi:hypothetical protein